MSKDKYQRRRLGGKRGAGVPGCGKHGVWRKTRGRSAKHGGTIFSPNNQVEILLFQIAMKFNRRETLRLVIKANLTSRKKENHSTFNFI